MKKTLMVLFGLGLLAFPAALSADADRAYFEEINPLISEKSALQNKISQINIALGESLGKAEGYDENEVRACYAQLVAAQDLLLAVELEMLLTLKRHHPAWRPPTTGARIIFNPHKKPSEWSQ